MINLHNCDCMDFVAKCNNNQYDLAIVDPPYGIERFKKINKGDAVHSENDNDKNWNNIKPSDDYFNELFRISKNQIIWGANNFNLPTSEYFIIWDKKQMYPNFARCEMAYTNVKKPAKIFEYSVMKIAGNKKHPAEKPIALYKWLLKNYAKPKDKILDTHGGSMSIAIACHDMGFDLDLCELDKDYFEAGKKRYENHISQVRMF